MRGKEILIWWLNCKMWNQKTWYQSWLPHLTKLCDPRQLVNFTLPPFSSWPHMRAPWNTPVQDVCCINYSLVSTHKVHLTNYLPLGSLMALFSEWGRHECFQDHVWKLSLLINASQCSDIICSTKVKRSCMLIKYTFLRFAESWSCFYVFSARCLYN